MRAYTDIRSDEELDHMMNQPLSVVYISRNGCSVCHALLPKIQQVMETYPGVEFGHITADDYEEVAGKLSIFTVPVVLIFSEGKELLRDARFIRIDEFRESLDKMTVLLER
ncbi:thioredoxin family protein [Jeotgalibacillus haloalkalitolerans]|uniref:Thioredoxin family protein n=1 Tax=Jeotgalibacillus haloalkalitolerans TaxID=3104292 RepID=A0ABU5KHZ6_9BACL|nr:thioredoxin family protein [Jeotgalibacillus sp. HH7-29]MDZ5710854.1 thioredoxin family protein [Jeotgalibacillus sp. HH7-29]